MTAIFLREWKKIWRGWLGWSFTAVLLLAAGITVQVVNVSRGTATFGNLFSVLPLVLIALFPVAACVVFTNARRNGEMAWLLSFPFRAASCWLGKFLALFALFLVPSAVIGLIPLFLSAFGSLSFGAAYAAWLGYLLFGAAFLAVCSFLAAATTNRVLSVALGVGVGLLLFLTDLIAALMERKAWISALAVILLALAAGIFVWLRAGKRDLLTRKRLLPAILIFAIPTVAAVVLIFAAPHFLTDRLPLAFRFCSPFVRLSGFLGGHFDLTALVYDLAVCGLFLYLTVFRGNLFAPTARRVATVCVTAAILLGLNIGVLFLPYRATHPDARGWDTFRLSGESKAALAGLRDDVTIRYYSHGGKTDADADLYSLVLQYAEASPHVRVQVIDTAKDDTFRELSAETLAYLDQGVSVSGKRSRLILRPTAFYYTYTESGMTLPLSIGDYQYFAYSVMQESGEEGLAAFMNATTVRLALESMLTNAVLYAARETVPKVALYGAEPDEFLSRYLDESGFQIVSTTGTDDFGSFNAVICNLTADLTAEEKDAFAAYLAGGGRLLVMGVTSPATPNLNALLTDAGISLATGNTHLDPSGTVLGQYGMTADAETPDGGRTVFVGINLTAYVNTLSGGADFAYFVRALNWLTDSENARVPVSDPVVPTNRLTPGTGQSIWAGVLWILVLPGAAVAIGAVRFYIRRKQTGQ